MATIRKRQDRWQAQVRRKGYNPVSKSFLLRSDALEWARHMEQQVDRRSLPYDPRKLDAITLHSMLERYRDEVIPQKRSPDREVGILNAFISRSSILVALPLSSITSAHFSSYLDQRLKTVKPATICRELGLIQHAYDIAAREWDYPIQDNPLSKVKKPEIRNKRERRLSFGEQKMLFRSLKVCQSKQMRQIALFAIATGMRRGEILSAEWKYLLWSIFLLYSVCKLRYPFLGKVGSLISKAC